MNGVDACLGMHGMPDKWETQYGIKGSNAAKSDKDKDGLNNLREYRLGLNPIQKDSDKDGLSNKQEYSLKLSPKKADSDNEADNN